MKFRLPFIPADIKDPQLRALVSELRRWSELLNGSIDFGPDVDNTAGLNMHVWRRRVTTPVVPNTEFSVTHGLGYLPSDFIVSRPSIAGDVYESVGGTAWTTDTIYLKCSAVSMSVTLFIF